jgi:hypothetical protein
VSQRIGHLVQMNVLDQLPCPSVRFATCSKGTSPTKSDQHFEKSDPVRRELRLFSSVEEFVAKIPTVFDSVVVVWNRPDELEVMHLSE